MKKVQDQKRRGAVGESKREREREIFGEKEGIERTPLTENEQRRRQRLRGVSMDPC